MKTKISILTISIFLTVVLFGISTYLQRKMIHYEPTMKCFVASKDIEQYEKVTPDDMKEVELPIAVVMNMKLVQGKQELTEMYAASKVFAGQILVKNQFDTRENLSVFEGEPGKEKISIKIKSAENGVSYSIKENDVVNVYATLRTEYSNRIFPNVERQYIGSETDGYCNMEVLHHVKVLGVFDHYGIPIRNRLDDEIPDTMMVCVIPEEARDINIIREIASFTITCLERDDMDESGND